jgi:hypothetical protein
VYSWLQVHQDGPRDVVVVVCLVEKDVLPVLDPVVIGGVLLEDAAGTDAVLPAQLLPELGPDCIDHLLLWLPH